MVKCWAWLPVSMELLKINLINKSDDMEIKRFQLYAYDSDEYDQGQSEKFKIGSYDTLDEMLAVANRLDKDIIQIYDVQEGEMLRGEKFGIYRQ